MSRIGKQTIVVPSGVTVKQSDGAVNIKGPKGELSRRFDADMVVTVADDGGTVRVTPARPAASGARWGTTTAHIKNMVRGVNTGFEKKLLLEGVGYKVNLTGENLVFNLGFSHQVTVGVPTGIRAVVDKNTIGLSGVDKELVGRFAAELRDLKKPEPYKGKGIRYDTEIIKRKQGKKVVA
ncbi:MAG: 50S ribosomal protein L6 [Patescibacteria group bacterium]